MAFWAHWLALLQLLGLITQQHRQEDCCFLHCLDELRQTCFSIPADFLGSLLFIEFTFTFLIWKVLKPNAQGSYCSLHYENCACWINQLIFSYHQMLKITIHPALTVSFLSYYLLKWQLDPASRHFIYQVHFYCLRVIANFAFSQSLPKSFIVNFMEITLVLSFSCRFLVCRFLQTWGVILPQ